MSEMSLTDIAYAAMKMYEDAAERAVEDEGPFVELYSEYVKEAREKVKSIAEANLFSLEEVEEAIRVIQLEAYLDQDIPF